MRKNFVNRLLSHAKKDKSIFLMVGDLGFSVIEEFRDELPDQFLNVGIAEQNMIGVASGLAMEGYNVFAYSIANFPTFRAAEQIRNDVDYHGASVKIVAVGGGLGYGSLGYSHHAIQDIGLMRLFPNTEIVTPSSDLETELAVDYLISTRAPAYLRLDKNSIPDQFAVDLQVNPGVWRSIRKFKEAKKAILAIGGAIRPATNFCDIHAEEYDLYSLPIWGSRAQVLQAEQVEKYEKVLVFEDHLRSGGLGSWMLESLELNNPSLLPKLELRSLGSDVLGRVGTQDYLEKIGGLWAT